MKDELAIVRLQRKRTPYSIVEAKLPGGEHDWDMGVPSPFQEKGFCKICGLKIEWTGRVWVCTNIYKNKPGNPIPTCSEEKMIEALE